MVLRLATYYKVKWVYPALAIFEVSASDTCFSFSIVICRSCSFNRPISSACSRMVVSLSFMSSRSGVKDGSCTRGFSSVFFWVSGKSLFKSSSSIHILGFIDDARKMLSPRLISSQSGETSYKSHIVASISVPAFILPFRISENLAGLMFRDSANAVLFGINCLANMAVVAKINRWFISSFVNIL